MPLPRLVISLIVLLFSLVLAPAVAVAQPIDGPLAVVLAAGDDDDDEDEDEGEDDGGSTAPLPEPTGPGGAESAAVEVGDDYFSPATVDIRPGGTVTWTFAANGHTVTADSGQAETFDVAQSSGTYTHTFNNEGRFTYVCNEHSDMRGIVIVRVPASGPDTTAPATPAGLAASPGDRSVSLDWADVDAADLAGYRVERQGADGAWTTIATPTGSSHVDAGLENGTGYAYRVSAYDLADNASAPGDAVAATPAAPAVSATERLVTVGGYAYGPEDVVVNRGDTVVWSWVGPDVNHSVTSAPGSADTFESHPGVADQAVTFAPAGGFRHRFDQTGSFDYLCRLHPDMTAKVTVVESGADGAQAGLVKAVAATPKATTAAAPTGERHSVKVADYKYTPRDLTIGQGDSVTWRWTGTDRDHSVTTKDGAPEAFDSHAGLKLGQIKDAPEGGAYTRTFDKAGTYPYFCRLHPDMTASVKVVAATVARAASSPLRVRAHRAAVRGRRVTLRFTLTEQARVRVTLKRAGKALKAWRLRGAKGANTRRLALPAAARRGGRYSLVLLATRANGDRSAPRRITVRVPRPR